MVRTSFVTWVFGKKIINYFINIFVIFKIIYEFMKYKNVYNIKLIFTDSNKQIFFFNFC